jgi:hypothetical protein
MPLKMQYAGMWWSLGVGLAMLVLVYVAVRSGWFRKAQGDVTPSTDAVPEPVEPVHHYPEGLGEAHGRVPFILKLIIGGYVVFLVGYLVSFYIKLQGPLGTLDAFLTK